jgi:hypothetical protein
MSDEMNARLGVYGGSTNAPLPDGTDTFQSLQEPKVDPVDDLSRFVMARIRELELEPRGEVMAVYDQPAGPMAHRYAKHVRRDCVVYRRIVAAYCTAKTGVPEIEDEEDGKAAWDRMIGLRIAVKTVANRWSDHHEFRDEWRLA